MTGPSAEPVIRFDRVSKSFGGRRVLDELSLEVHAGRACCILGRSGTGKSVALKHIVGLLKPDSGRVVIEGQDITELDTRALTPVRLRIGFLFQHAALFDSISVGENVAFPLRRHTRLKEREIKSYIQCRLESAGYQGKDIFNAGALQRIAHYSDGIPRLINAVCDKCLLAGFVKQRDSIDFSLAGLAIRELEGKVDV